jgi:hypothetical protein
VGVVTEYVGTISATKLQAGHSFAFDEHTVVKIVFVDHLNLGQNRNLAGRHGGEWHIVSVSCDHPEKGRIASWFWHDDQVHLLQEVPGTLKDREEYHKMMRRTSAPPPPPKPKIKVARVAVDPVPPTPVDEQKSRRPRVRRFVATDPRLV